MVSIEKSYEKMMELMPISGNSHMFKVYNTVSLWWIEDYVYQFNLNYPLVNPQTRLDRLVQPEVFHSNARI